ncbi:MAG TPA: DUF4476 domain-containing protein [Puia sp.]|nr:DUF4476 domain-containing protein [Puia sp.]
MTKIRLLVLSFLFGGNVFAQKNHFIAIQSENKQSFYVKAAENVLKSTPTGHIIIPKLVDSTYIFTIGFTKTPTAEEQFSIVLTKDVGFILKIGKDNRLVLSNPQTAQLIAPIRQQQYFVSEDSATTTTSTTSVTKKADQSFSKLMAQVVNDSAVMENMYVADEPKKEVTKTETPTKPVIINDSSVANQQKKKNEITKIETSSKPIITADSSAITQRKKRTEDATLHKKIAVIKTPEKKEKLIQQQIQPVVTKLSEKKNVSSFELVYEDVSKNGKKDTINIIIPFDSAVNKPTVVNNNKKETIIPETKPGIKSDTAKFMTAKNIPAIKDSNNIPTDGKSLFKAKTKNVKKDSSVVDTTKSKLFRAIVTNANCKNTATDYDVDKLRVKIMAIEDEDDKISIAKKVFKAKCFSTNQIKALSEVFPNDAGKYKLFDAAYAYVYDLNNFTSLQSLLKDDYYISRFKAMIK